MKTKIGKWVMAGLIIAAMAAPLPALAGWGGGPRGNGPGAQTRIDCPNYGQRLRDGSCQNRGGNWRQGRGRNADQRANMACWGGGPRYGAGNRGPAQN